MNRYLAALLLIAIATPSYAITTGVTTNGPAANPAARAPLKAEAAKAMADDSSGLRKGTLEQVNLAEGTFHVFGEAHTFDANKVRIFGKDGKPTTVHALRRGSPVRFTLDPADVSRRRVAVIYLD